MTDLGLMIDSKSLKDCKDEISSQFSSLTNHGNKMKAVIIASFLFQESIDAIKKIDPNNFLDSLRDELNRQIKTGDEWMLKENMMKEHLAKNQEVIFSFEGCEKSVAELSDKVEQLLSEYDYVLKGLCFERNRKSIAEIEAELNIDNR